MGRGDAGPSPDIAPVHVREVQPHITFTPMRGRIGAGVIPRDVGRGAQLDTTPLLMHVGGDLREDRTGRRDMRESYLTPA
jgi:hypothetical protein